ncbi:MAG: homoserine dehydrogenase [Clostridia bacterium]|nr:homoserine dehydrogenase [Clostridia bacterium]
MINVAILGYGTVGSGVYEVLTKNAESIKKKAGDEIRVKYILDIRDFSDAPNAHLFTKDFNDILNDPEVSIVAEVIGGIKPSYDFTKAALMAGKSVVTSNKELVANKGYELLKIAKDKGISYLFEASVGGGIPIIRPMHQCLAANEIEEITGILNGTTNYILTKMINEHLSFDEVLKDAQKKGYAEANPDADVLGIDACRKIAILSSLAFSMQVSPDKIHTEGITGISLTDVQYAKATSSVIKLLGRSVLNSDGTVSVLVAPFIISSSNPLANVDDVFNAILVKGDSIGDVMFYGRGAGKLPTASAVVADIIDASKGRRDIFWGEVDYENVRDFNTYEHEFYVRTTDASVDMKAAVYSIFGTVKRIVREDMPAGEYTFLTKSFSEEQMKENIDKLSASGCCKVGSVIRVL